MLKKSTKITSLVVAAATMATMVPAMAADKKMADKDGTIYRAVSYKDGKLYIDGKDIQDAKDEDGVFFLDNGKSTEVDSYIDSGDEITAIYGEKYVEIDEGDYYVDLTNGKVTDDSLRKDDREDAASELRKKVRKHDPSRYTEDTRDKVADVDTDKYGLSGEIWEVTAAPFTAPYYQVDYLKFDEGKADHVFAFDKAGNVTTADTATVYTDGKGNYIDADNDLGKVNVVVKKDAIGGNYSYAKNTDKTIDEVTSAAQAQVAAKNNPVHAAFYVDPDDKVSEYEAIEFTEVGTETSKDKDLEVSVSVGHVKTLASDKDYIYRLAALKVSYTNLLAYNQVCDDYAKYDFDKKSDVNKADFTREVTTGETVFFGSTKNPVAVKANEGGVFYVIQKISKEQGDDKDDAKLPKKTETYFTTENKDWRKKEEAVITSTDKNVFTDGNDDRDVLAKDKDGWDFTAVGGKVTAYEGLNTIFNDDGSNDGKFNDLNGNDEINAWTYSLKNSNGFYFIDKEDGGKEIEDEDEYGTAIDKDGNFWLLTSGKIYKYNNDGDFDLKYRCDGGLNELSVYDDNNLVAYNEDDDVYAIVGGKSSTGEYEVKDEETTTDTTTTAQAGWVQDATTGAWSYVKADGTKAIGWFQSPTSGLWYYMDANGVMQANGWIQDGGSWYYLKADGAMATGWVYTGGAWYFLKNTAGNMGAMQTGWIQTGGKWYYCNASGAMLSNTTVDGYVLGADGAWIK